MKKPKIKNLRVDLDETRRIRESISKQKSVKITINIDAATLSKLRAQAQKSGVPYQRLINRALTEHLTSQDLKESGLDRIEKELKQLKKRLVA